MAVDICFKQKDAKFVQEIFENSHFHILFDCDGLILDTEPIYSSAALVTIKHFLSQHGKPVPSEDLFPHNVKLKVMGGSKSQVSTQMAEYLNSKFLLPVTSEDWTHFSTPIEEEMFALGCNLMPAIPEIIRIFVEKKYPIAVATSSNRGTFLLKSQKHANLFKSFPVITCGDDYDYSDTDKIHDLPKVQGKPHPSIFKTARHHLNRSSAHPGIVLEDSPNGVVAALRSGHSCIWVPDKNVPEGFGVVQEILNKFAEERESFKNLWVYRAESLNEIVINII